MRAKPGRALRLDWILLACSLSACSQGPTSDQIRADLDEWIAGKSLVYGRILLRAGEMEIQEPEVVSRNLLAYPLRLTLEPVESKHQEALRSPKQRAQMRRVLPRVYRVLELAGHPVSMRVLYREKNGAWVFEGFEPDLDTQP